jgi:hypothetical protein
MLCVTKWIHVGHCKPFDCHNLTEPHFLQLLRLCPKLGHDYCLMPNTSMNKNKNGKFTIEGGIKKAFHLHITPVCILGVCTCLTVRAIFMFYVERIKAKAHRVSRYLARYVQK